MHFEVLLRLRDENGQILPPGNFIPAAERYGLMPSLDRWVITHALQTLAQQPGQPSWWKPAPSISPAQPGRRRPAGICEGAVAAAPRCAAKAVFEITETSAIGNLSNATG
jgi:EAL domain-containing protein (putative c-di-GMP-specific phosphodiesterase class I)